MEWSEVEWSVHHTRALPNPQPFLRPLATTRSLPLTRYHSFPPPLCHYQSLTMGSLRSPFGLTTFTHYSLLTTYPPLPTTQPIDQ